jgi:signal transduction histidine kinase
MSIGLRAQLVLALSLAFIVTFTLLGIATVQIAESGRRIERRRASETVARALAAGIDELGANRGTRAAALADSVLADRAIQGVEIAWPGIEPVVRGASTTTDVVTAEMARGGEVRLFLRPVDRTEGGASKLLLLYVAFTGGAILLLAYVSLTHLIVRPVSALTEASERLAKGGRHVDVPVRGAAEVARLAVSFNRMASELRSERQALEDRLRELEKTTHELESAQAQLVRSERLASVGRLSAGVAHEIGNPLAAILGMIELARDPELDAAEREEFLRRIQQETERINRIIRDLLDFSRRGRDSADAMATTDLRHVVEDASRLVAPQKDLREVSIERRLAPNLPDVRGPSDQLTQVVLNLLLNAADAIEGDGAILVEVGASDRSGFVRLAVTDSGPGIAKEVFEHIFEPFVTTKPAGEGTGLGLAVVHAIVDRLGGAIRAESAESGGARFVVELPAASAAPPSEADTGDEDDEPEDDEV